MLLTMNMYFIISKNEQDSLWRQGVQVSKARSRAPRDALCQLGLAPLAAPDGASLTGLTQVQQHHGACFVFEQIHMTFRSNFPLLSPSLPPLLLPAPREV